jgi:hypothetical protein
MKPLTLKREPTPAERQKRAVADQLGYDAFAAFLGSLPGDPAVRRRASERLARLLGAFVADGHGEAALHCTLAGAVVAGAPAYRSGKPGQAAAEAVFAKGEAA